MLGPDLLSTVVSVTNSGHTFLHSTNLPSWVSSNYDFAVKTIVRRNKPTSVRNESSGLRKDGDVAVQNYPNPFNQETTITFVLTNPQKTTLTVFDITGIMVRRLIQNDILFGVQSIIWDGKDSNSIEVGTGMYFFYLKINREIYTRKTLLIDKEYHFILVNNTSQINVKFI